MCDVMVRLVPIDEAWDRQISGYAFDIYHLSSWLKASSVIEEGNPKGIIAEYNDIKVFIPIIVRELKGGLCDATTPYGYGGPINTRHLDSTSMNLILTEIKKFLHKNDFISLFLRLHPILNKSWHTKDIIGTTIEHGPTLVSDLTKTEEQHWLETQRRHRKDINKAKKNNFDIEIGTLSKDNIPDFLEIYNDTMMRNKAKNFYYFDESYFYELSSNLKDRLLLFMAYFEGKPVSAILCTLSKETGIIQSHLGGCLSDYQHLNPYKLLTHSTRSWGRENGYKFLHLGGGIGANKDTLYDYKKGFSSYELSFRTYRMVVNEDIYNKLVNEHLSSRKSYSSDFFPEYRA